MKLVFRQVNSLGNNIFSLSYKSSNRGLKFISKKVRNRISAKFHTKFIMNDNRRAEYAQRDKA